MGRRVMGVTAWVVVLVPLACAPDIAPPVDRRAIDPGPLDAAVGLQFEGPEFTLQPGEEKMLCWVPDSVRSNDLKIARFEGVQSELGHHVLAMESQRPREPGTSFDCTNIAQMAELEPLILPSPGGSFLPEDHYVRLRSDATVVLQSHYVNYTTDPIVVRDFARFFFADEGRPLVEASYLIINRASFRLDGGPQSVQADCTIADNISLVATVGHMHELGRSFHLERAAPTAETLYTVDAWTTDMRDEPPLQTWPVDDAVVLAAGDVLRVTCDYDNTTGAPVGFPQEMCSSISAYAPARPEGVILCD